MLAALTVSAAMSEGTRLRRRADRLSGIVTEARVASSAAGLRAPLDSGGEKQREMSSRERTVWGWPALPEVPTLGWEVPSMTSDAPTCRTAEMPPLLLCVEADTLWQALRRYTSAAAGVRVVTCRSGRDALTLSARRTFQAALIDTDLPDGNAVDLARLLKTAQPWLYLVLSSSRHWRTAEEQSVFDAFVGKGDDPELAGMLRHLNASNGVRERSFVAIETQGGPGTSGLRATIELDQEKGRQRLTSRLPDRTLADRDPV